ncbi:hypothetical protein LTR73_004774 [Friedmanniomyces endolithicus]|uniref:DUF7730 domain-containing protein n=2 Tax=Friedmanniomyces endolithicus TaxID=329885 RepID=A0AAN6FC84_9PEZI|nr:hypothetical protein LTR82_013086 [Friedmanniomyces endolithicus]KAK0828465.1 hypothetical protein LTR73_004774 [Friedmanniomyces endolithicus]
MASMDIRNQQSTNTSDQTLCRLLDLPPELRNHIYEYLLLGGEDEAPVRVTDCLSDERGLQPNILQKGSEDLWQPPAILQTCRQIRGEATPLYYTTNTFDVVVDSRNLERTICHWLSALGSHTRDKIRTIHLGLMYDRLEVAETGLEMFDDMLNEADCQVRRGTISVQVFERSGLVEMEDAHTSPLLRLPPELRNAIYSYALVNPHEVLVTDHWRAPALLSTGKQVRREAVNIYFAENTFRIEMFTLISGPLREAGYMPALARWFHAISTLGRAALKTVRIDDIFYRTHDEANEALLYYATGLAEAGCGVADGVLFVEGRISDFEVSVEKPFWTNNPTTDFARVEQQHIQGMKKS